MVLLTNTKYAYKHHIDLELYCAEFLDDQVNGAERGFRLRKKGTSQSITFLCPSEPDRNSLVKQIRDCLNELEETRPARAYLQHANDLKTRNKSISISTTTTTSRTQLHQHRSSISSQSQPNCNSTLSNIQSSPQLVGTPNQISFPTRSPNPSTTIKSIVETQTGTNSPSRRDSTSIRDSEQVSEAQQQTFTPSSSINQQFLFTSQSNKFNQISIDTPVSHTVRRLDETENIEKQIQEFQENGT